MVKLQDYIKVIPNILDKQICKRIVNNKEYEWEKGLVDDAEINHQIRKCSVAGISADDWYDVNMAVAETLKEFQRLLPAPSFTFTEEWGDPRLLKYEKGEYITQHIDDQCTYAGQGIRRVSMSFLLNEDYEGGEMQFGDYKVNGPTGSAIIFPSNFCFPHEVLPIKSGTRYSILTWMQ